MIDPARRTGYNLGMVDSTTPSDALLTTKLYAPPIPSTFVPRPRLMAQLDVLLHPPHALALIVAPVGFGKSSLAAAWCRAQPVATAWLSLDADDNDPQRFFCICSPRCKARCRIARRSTKSNCSRACPMLPR